MLNFIGEKSNCTGCTACYAICPKNCIEMIKDEEGFFYPEIKGDCIQCGACQKVCPINNGVQNSKETIKQEAIAACTTDNEVWRNSSSGGAFYEISKLFINAFPNNICIYGARFDNLQVIHDSFTKISEIKNFQKSKYIQSYMGKSFQKVKEKLIDGKVVLFSGTPCQIAGLKNYLGKKYERLFCIDLICHGVGSQDVFEKCLEYMSDRENDKIIHYSFREKRKRYGNYQRYLSKHMYANGKTKFVLEDAYTKLFLEQLCLRPSCGENCRFRCQNRVGDITLADLNNKIGIFPKLKDQRGYSTVIANSDNGKIVLQRLNKIMKAYPCKIEDIKKYNPLFYRTTPENPNRNKFFSDYTRGMNIEDLLNKYIPKKKKTVNDFMMVHIPWKVKFYIYQIINKLKILKQTRGNK